MIHIRTLFVFVKDAKLFSRWRCCSVFPLAVKTLLLTDALLSVFSNGSYPNGHEVDVASVKTVMMLWF